MQRAVSCRARHPDPRTPRSIALEHSPPNLTEAGGRVLNRLISQHRRGTDIRERSTSAL
jgi:hypothetical protein